MIRTVSVLLSMWLAIAAAAFGSETDQGILEQIGEKWDFQSTAVSTAIITFRLARSNTFGGLESNSPEAFEEAIAPVVRDELTAEARESLVMSLFGIPLADVLEARFVFDGERVREEFGDTIQIAVDGIHTVSDPRNNQVAIKDRLDSRRRIMKLRDFRFLPKSTLLPKITRITSGEDLPGRVVLHTIADNGHRKEYHVDRDTGDVYRYIRTRSANDDRLILQILQADFRTLPGGAQMPFFWLSINYGPNGETSLIEVVMVESMDVNVDVSPDEFVFASPAGTVVFDHRGRAGREPRSHRLQEDKADTLAYIDSERERIAALRGSPVPGVENNRSTVQWLLVFNIVVALVITAFLVIRRIRVSRRGSNK